MESFSFQSQLVSALEVLAEAALAEINRRVDGGCALLRVEMTRSQRDIAVLKRRCALLEAELKRSRIRRRRRSSVSRRCCYAAAAERCPPLVQIVVDEETDAPWEGEMVVENLQNPQCAAVQPSDLLLIKQERADEDTVENTSGLDVPQACQREALAVPYHTDSAPSLPNTYHSFPDEEPIRSQDEPELRVKPEEEEEEEEADGSTAVIGTDHLFMTGQADGQLWSSNQGIDAAGHLFPFAQQQQQQQQYEQSASTYICTSGLPLSQAAPPHAAPPVVRPHAAARVRRWSRAFGCRRPQEGPGPGPSPSPLTQPRPAAEDGWSPWRQDNQGAPAWPHPAPGRRARRAWPPRRPAAAGGERRFCCSYCGKGFSRLCQMQEHLRSHTGEKPFSCAQCGRSFTKQCNLVRHAVVHSGEKPYACASCGKCFTQRSSLKSHQKTAH